MNQLRRDFRLVLNPKIVETLEVHIYVHRSMAFMNTFIVESLRAVEVPFTVSHHYHPQHPTYSLPFLIINSKTVLETHSLISFVLRLPSLKCPPEQGIEKVQSRLVVEAAFKTAHDLSEVAQVLTEYDPNPYFMFISPLKKWAYYRQSIRVKERLSLDTDYLTDQGDLNSEYFLFKLNELCEIYQNVTEENKSISTSNTFKVIMIALLKQFTFNSKKITNIALANPVFLLVEREAPFFLEGLSAPVEEPRNLIYCDIDLPIRHQNTGIAVKDQKHLKTMGLFKLAMAVSIIAMVVRYGQLRE